MQCPGSRVSRNVDGAIALECPSLNRRCADGGVPCDGGAHLRFGEDCGSIAPTRPTTARFADYCHHEVPARSKCAPLRGPQSACAPYWPELRRPACDPLCRCK